MSVSCLSGIAVSLAGLIFFCFPGLIFSRRLLGRESSPLAVTALGLPLGLALGTGLSVLLAWISGKPLLSALVSVGLLSIAAAFLPGLDGIVITPYQGRRWNYTVIISMAALLAIIIAPISQVGSRTVQGYAYGNYFNVDHLKNLALSSSLGRTEFPPGSPFMAGCRLRYYWFYLWFPGLLYRTGLNASSFETAFMTYGCVWSLVLVLMLFLWWRRLGVSSRWGAAALGIAVAAPSLNAVTYIWRLALHKNLTPSLLFAQDTEFISPLNFARVPFFVDGLFRYVLYIQLHLFGLILLLTSLWILVSATPGNERKTLFLSAVPAVVGLFFTDIVSVLGVLIWSAGALCLVFRVRRSPKIIWNSLKYTGLGAVFVCAVTACLLPGTRAGLQVLFLLKMTGHLMVEYGPLLFLGLIGLSVIKKPELSSMFSTMVVISLGVLFLVGERGYLKLYLPSFISGALNRYPFHISVKTSVVLLGALLVLAGPGLGKIADACKRSGRVRLGTALLLVLVVLALPGSVVDLGYHCNTGGILRNIYIHPEEMKALSWIRGNVSQRTVFLCAPYRPGSLEHPENTVSVIPSLAFRDVLVGDPHHTLLYTSGQAVEEMSRRSRLVRRVLQTTHPVGIEKLLHELGVTHVFLGPRETELWEKQTVDRLRKILPVVYSSDTVSVHEVPPER